MELGLNTETVAGSGGLGAVLMTIWHQFRSGQINKVIWRRIDEVAEDVNGHKVEDAKTYATREEIASLRTHIDSKFDAMNGTLISLFKSGKK